MATQHKRDSNTDKHVYAACVLPITCLSSGDYVVEQQHEKTGRWSWTNLLNECRRSILPWLDSIHPSYARMVQSHSQLEPLSSGLLLKTFTNNKNSQSSNCIKRNLKYCLKLKNKNKWTKNSPKQTNQKPPKTNKQKNFQKSHYANNQSLNTFATFFSQFNESIKLNQLSLLPWKRTWKRLLSSNQLVCLKVL